MSDAGPRTEMWSQFVDKAGVKDVAEIGVFRGAFAAHLLGTCPGIATYYLVDPWRHLDDWNKPANKADDVFEEIRQDALRRTAPYEDKRVLLRGRTTEVIDQIPDGGLDFAYIDGDHTLRGITIDLFRVFPKIREGGWIGGDDFCRSIWQHEEAFEPTLVFPFAVYFAEAMAARIYALPHNQFLIEKVKGGRHEFVDLTGRYGELGLRSQLRQRQGEAPTTGTSKRRSPLSAGLSRVRGKLAR